MRKVALIFLLSTLAYGQSSSGVLSPNRATDWTQAGIPGGIPSGSWTKCGATITAYGSIGSPASPSTIINALNHTGTGYTTCTANQYILLGSGDFYLNAAIRNVGQSNVELRGSGPTSTKLHFSAGSTCQGGNGNCMVGFEASGLTCTTCSPSFHNATAGLTKGSTVITFDSVSGWSVGQILILDQCDTALTGSTGSATCSGTPTDNNGLYVCEYSTTGSDRSCAFNHGNGTERTNRGQEEVAVITNISGTNVTIDTPLINPNWTTGLFPQGWSVTSGQPVKNVGITNLLIDGTGTSSTHGASFAGVNGYWLRNVVIEEIQNQSMYDTMTVHGLLQSNYLYACGQLNPSSDYSGFNVSNYGTVLIENNVFHGCGVSPQFNGPGAGAVVFGNYAVYAFNGPQFWAQHAAGVHYNLYEENVAKDWFGDQIHGPVMMNTLYRNMLFGWQSCAIVGTSGCGTQTNLWPIGDLSYNRYENFINNVFGTPAIQGVAGSGYTVSLDFGYFTSAGTGSGTGTYIYNLGSGNGGSGGNSAQWPHDPIVATTGMFWGNWDAHNASAQWNTAEVPSGISSFPNAVPTSTCTSGIACPDSFVYGSRPSWWDSSIPFPAIGKGVTGNMGQIAGTINRAAHYSGTAAIAGATFGGDTSVSAWGGLFNCIPAMCAWFTNGGLPDGSNAILAFDADTWYASATQAATPVASPAGSIFTPTVTISLSSTSPSPTIYYTTNGTTPTHGSSVYSTPLTFSVTTTLKAIAASSGLTDSAVMTEVYTLSATATTPSYSPTGSQIYGTTVNISTNTPCLPYIYWSSIHNPPTNADNNTTTFSVIASATIFGKVIGCPGFSDSAVGSASFSPVTATPVIDTQSGSAPQWLNVSDSTLSSTIYCSVDGSTPTSSLPSYTHHLWIAKSMVLKCLATSSGNADSSVASSTITIATQKTSFNLSAVSSSQAVGPYPPQNRMCCGTNVTTLEASRGTYTLTAYHAWQAASASHSAQTWYTVQGFPPWMTGLGANESAPPTDLNVSAACQNVLTGTTTTDCSMKEFITKLMEDCTGLTVLPANPAPCTGLDVIEVINEFNTDSASGSSTGWTGTYADLATLANDISGVVHAWSSNTIVVLGSASGIVGFHSNGENAHFDTALETLAADWAGISGASLPDAISYHAYPSRQTVSPTPMPDTIVSNSDTACTGGNTPNVSCYVAVKDEGSTIAGANVLQNAAIVKWAKFLPIYSTEGGFGQLQQLCTLTSGTTLCQGYVSEHMLAVAANNLVDVSMFYAAFDSPCGSTNWGCYWQSSAGVTSGWYQAFTQTQSWLNSAVVTGPLTSSSITGGTKWTLPLTVGGNAAEATWCDAWLTNCTASTSFSTKQLLTGATSSTGGSVTLTQLPMLLTNGGTPGPPNSVSVIVIGP